MYMYLYTVRTCTDKLIDRSLTGVFFLNLKVNNKCEDKKEAKNKCANKDASS